MLNLIYIFQREILRMIITWQNTDSHSWKREKMPVKTCGMWTYTREKDRLANFCLIILTVLILGLSFCHETIQMSDKSLVPYIWYAPSKLLSNEHWYWDVTGHKKSILKLTIAFHCQNETGFRHRNSLS